ncbi:MAG: ABC-F family ATP-binding cassette domain-containing protein, partial [Actinobacteria bacterium]|nr:ABC-F family ATP-binding cassette domain-containing protein [Actinomycetota bacterium]
MGHVEVNTVSYSLPDGRPLLDEVTFRVGGGATAALVGPNGTGKTTLLRIIAGDLAADAGTVTSSGGTGVMRQFVGHGKRRTRHGERGYDDVGGLLLSLAPARIRTAADALESSELAMMSSEDEPTQLRYAQALVDWADAGGYEIETLWDVCTTAALGVEYRRAHYRTLETLSGGEQKRLALEALLSGPEEVLLLDEPDNFLDVPAKRWLEQRLADTPKTVLLVSHDRELLSRAATQIVTLEPTALGANAWVHGGSFSTYAVARAERSSRLEELRRRWDEEHDKLKTLVATLRVKAEYNDGMSSRYQAAKTRLAKFEEAGPPQLVPVEQKVSMRLIGGRTGKRAVVCERLELTGLMQPFDAELWFGERIGVLG